MSLLLGVQVPQILVVPAGRVSLDVAEETIELVEAYGMRLDESQKITLRTGMGLDAGGMWAAPTMGDAECRQNGKGDTIQAREAAGALLLTERIMHTAHEMPTVNQAFLRMVGWLESRADLRKRVKKIWYGNGNQAIDFRNGAMIGYRTRTGGGGRGFDEIDLIVYDEAQHAQPEHLAASAPTMAVAENPQAWFAGSPGFATSSVWWSLRLQALRGEAERFGFVEHTAEGLSFDDDGVLVSVRPDPLDESARAEANAAYGSRISNDYLNDQLRRMGESLFLREHMGVWDPLPDDAGAKPAKLPKDAWVRARTDADFDGPVTLAFEVSMDAEWSSIVLGAGDQQSPYWQQLAHRKGVGWLADEMVRIVRTLKPTRIGCVGTGPAGAQVGPVMLALSQAGLAQPLEQLSMVEYRQACGAVYADIVEGRLHWYSGSGPLDAAARDAAARQVGDAWSWDIRNVTVPISPLVAATVARALLPVQVVKAPSKVRVHSF